MSGVFVDSIPILSFHEQFSKSLEVKEAKELVVGKNSYPVGLQRNRFKVFAKDDYVCRWCRYRALTANLFSYPKGDTFGYYIHLTTSNDKMLTIDHIIPRAKGGTNHPENIQTLCNKCNSKKSSYYPLATILVLAPGSTKTGQARGLLLASNGNYYNSSRRTPIIRKEKLFLQRPSHTINIQVREYERLRGMACD